MTENSPVLATWYDQQEQNREPYLKRAREASKLTIPFLVPEEGQGNTEFVKLYQSDGARGVNNLASKLLLTLLPPNTPFFKLAIDIFELAQLKAESEDGEDFEAELNNALSRIEQAVVTEVETSAVRVHLFEALRQLIVAGNVLMYIPQAEDQESDIRIYKLDSYCVLRDPDGFVRKIVIREAITEDEVPDGIEAQPANTGDSKTSSEPVFYLYTGIERLEDDTWEVFQEVSGQEVPDSRGTFDDDENPYIAARFNKIDGQDYGESFVYEYIGDLITVESLSESIVTATAAAAKVVFLVNPTGNAKPKTLAATPNGGFAPGLEGDVVPLQLNKQADMQVAQSVLNEIRERLAKSFLLNTSIQRSGERVTAEEIRFMAQELEDGIGGIHSILSSDISVPMVNALMKRMQSQSRLPKLPDGVVKTQIVTGIDAIGRGHDLNNMRIFISDLVSMLGPQAVPQFINVDNLITRLGTATGVPLEGLVKTTEQREQEQQQAQQAQLAQSVAPEITRQAGKALAE